MKSILTLLIVVMLCATGRANTNAVLCGIRIVETRDQLHPPRGKLGERGPYQFRRATWRMHTSSSFDLAENREVANNVAKRHYAWIQTQLRANGIEPTAYLVAVAWNAGVNAVIRGNAPAVAHDYATRVLNIAGSVRQEEPAPPAAAPEPTWKTPAPVLVAIETSAQPESPVTPSPTPASAAPSATVIASAETPASDDPVAVRYHANPILLAFNQTPAPPPPSDVLPAPFGLRSTLLLAADLPPTFGRM